MTRMEWSEGSSLKREGRSSSRMKGGCGPATSLNSSCKVGSLCKYIWKDCRILHLYSLKGEISFHHPLCYCLDFYHSNNYFNSSRPWKQEFLFPKVGHRNIPPTYLSWSGPQRNFLLYPGLTLGHKTVLIPEGCCLGPWRKAHCAQRIKII